MKRNDDTCNTAILILVILCVVMYFLGKYT